MIICLKCGKKITAKQGKKLFCDKSCGNSYRQQIKRDERKKTKLVDTELVKIELIDIEPVKIELVKIELTETEQEDDTWAKLTVLRKRTKVVAGIVKLARANHEILAKESVINEHINDNFSILDCPFYKRIEARMNVQLGAEIVEQNKKYLQEILIAKMKIRNIKGY